MHLFCSTSIRGWKRRALLLPIFAVTGCAVGPDFVSPGTPDLDRYTPEKLQTIGGGKGAQHLLIGADIPQRWWEVFRNEKLNKLIAASIAQNPTLQAAEAAIRMAYYNAEAQKGAFLPQVAFESNDSSVRQSFQQNFQNAAPSNPYGLFLRQLTVTYTLDIWGGNRRAVESLEAQTDQQRYQLEAAYLSLAANIAAAAVQEASLRGQIAAIQKAIAVEREILDLMRSRLDVGSSSKAEVLVQETALGQALQLLPPLEKQLAQQRDLLTALAGQYSTAEVRETFRLEALKLPNSVPLTLPSKFVRQRPDVRGAEANMHSAAAQIGVSIAARLPNVGLSAAGGYSSFNLLQQFIPGSGFYVLTGSISHTIFDGFALLNKQKAAEAGFVQAEAQYRQAVISAFQNVADALRALQADTKAVKVATYTEESARKNLAIVRAQLRIGSVSLFELLNAQQSYLTASVAVVQAEGNRLADVIGLFMALGGGWKDENLRDLVPVGPNSPTSTQVDAIKAPVNSSWFPSFLN
jgi:NodT family efflux transporter outer membrane factor (OMF) lipoprotein